MTENNFPNNPEKVSEVIFFQNEKGIIVGGYINLYDLEKTDISYGEDILITDLLTLKKSLSFSLDANGLYNFNDVNINSQNDWRKITPTELLKEVKEICKYYKKYNFETKIYQVSNFSYGSIPEVIFDESKPISEPQNKGELLQIIENSNLELAKFLIEKDRIEQEQKKLNPPQNIIPYRMNPYKIVNEGWCR